VHQRVGSSGSMRPPRIELGAQGKATRVRDEATADGVAEASPQRGTRRGDRGLAT
jgi:hypothetical protein